MNKVATHAFLALVAVASLPAQTRYLYSPPFLEATEGQNSSAFFGCYPKMRLQLVDGDQRGRVAAIKEIAFRLDDRSYNSASGAGRRFANVSIDMGDGDHASFGSDFAANRRSTPTRCFSATLTWPTTTGFPLTRPALWGGTSGGFGLPFSASWSMLGQRDLLVDFEFSGGVLTNNDPWPGSISREYAFDSYGQAGGSVSGTYVQYPATRLNNNSVGVTGRCNDSAFGGDNAGAFGMIYVYVYDAYNTNIKWRNQVRIFSTSYHTAFNAPVIHAWGFGAPSSVGLDIGTGCNRLHAIGPYVLQTFTTLPRAVDPTGHSGFYDTLVPWSGSYANLKITMQAAWSDSVTRQLNLTQARQVTLPALPPLGATPRRAALLQYHTYAPEGPFESYTHNPAFRYAF